MHFRHFSVIRFRLMSRIPSFIFVFRHFSVIRFRLPSFFHHSFSSHVEDFVIHFVHLLPHLSYGTTWSGLWPEAGA